MTRYNFEQILAALSMAAMGLAVAIGIILRATCPCGCRGGAR